MPAQRIRGVWRARLLIELSKGPAHFNAVGRAIRVPHPQSLSRLLKKLEREGHVGRTLHEIGPPVITSWVLTLSGHMLVASAQALLAEAASLRDEREREFHRNRPIFDHINTRVDDIAR
jgi:DNA-binding HxlR family transcriptional regulator